MGERWWVSAYLYGWAGSNDILVCSSRSGRRKEHGWALWGWSLRTHLEHRKFVGFFKEHYLYRKFSYPYIWLIEIMNTIP
jgi:hypothetical protein